MKRAIGVVVAGVALAIVGWVGAAGSASAHEGTAATVPAAPVAGAGELPGVAEYVPPPTPAAMTEPTDRWSALSVMVAATAVIATGAAAVAVALRRRRVDVPWPGGLRLAGAGALLFTGVAHCALAPSHWAEGWHLGAFFVASGLVLVGQAGLLWLRPSPGAYRSVLVSTAVLVVLYVAVRQFALPLVDHQDPYLLRDVPVKAAELLAAGLAATALLRARPASPLAPRVATA